MNAKFIERPVGIKMISGIYCFIGLSLLLIGLFAFFASLKRGILWLDLILTCFLVILSGVIFIQGVNIFKLKRSALHIVLLIHGASLSGQIITMATVMFVLNTSSVATLIINISMMIYLLIPKNRALFCY